MKTPSLAPYYLWYFLLFITVETFYRTAVILLEVQSGLAGLFAVALVCSAVINRRFQTRFKRNYASSEKWRLIRSCTLISGILSSFQPFIVLIVLSFFSKGVSSWCHEHPRLLSCASPTTLFCLAQEACSAPKRIWRPKRVCCSLWSCMQLRP